MRADTDLEAGIADLLADPQYEGHPLREALDALLNKYQDHLKQLERLTSISDGFQSAMRDRDRSMSERYSRQIRQLRKIVRISDHYQEMQRELNEALRIASTQDILTKLPNRRLMLDRLNAEVERVDRQESFFSLALIDADHFKQINDRYGHDVGDGALVGLARALAGELRAYDVCARWGGEEFLVLLPETSGAAAHEIATRLCSIVHALQLPELEGSTRLSISAGVAEHRAGAALADTIKRADRALYDAKDAGRNRAVLAE